MSSISEHDAKMQGVSPALSTADLPIASKTTPTATIAVAPDNSAHADLSSEQIQEAGTMATEPESDQGAANKFLYPEFAGPAGREYLETLLLFCIPTALHRTWKAAVRFQAPGNMCYVGPRKLTTKDPKERPATQVGERKIQLDFAELEIRGLLKRYQDRLPVWDEGELKLKWATVKDFSELYELAHQFDCWRRSDDYIPPQREYLDQLLANPELAAWLCRFECYRKILLCKKPGRKAKPKVARQQPTAESILAFQAQQQAEQQAVSSPQTNVQRVNLYNNTQKKEGSPNPESRIPHQEFFRKDDSTDSGSNLEEGEGANPSATNCSQNQARVAQDYTKNEENEEQQDPSPTPLLSNPTNQKSKEKGNASARHVKEVDRVESAETVPEVVLARELARQVTEANETTARGRTGVWKGKSGRKQPYRGDGKPRPPENSLIRSFLGQFAQAFNDGNFEGTVTGALRLAAQVGTARALLVLVRAYQETEHYPGPITSVNNTNQRKTKMPLFNHFQQDFARGVSTGQWSYTWDDLMETLAEEDRVKEWAVEHQAEIEAVQRELEQAEGPSLSGGQDQRVEAGQAETGGSTEVRPRGQGRTQEQRDARAAYAETVRRSLIRQGAVGDAELEVMTEHHACGNPLWYFPDRFNLSNVSQRKCAHCHPDWQRWSSEAIETIHTILDH